MNISLSALTAFIGIKDLRGDNMAIDIKKALKTVNEAIVGLGAVGQSVIMALIVLGVMIAAVTSGNITLSSGMNTQLNTMDTTASGWFSTGIGAVTTVAALIVVVVLLVLFRQNGSKRKKNSGSMY